MMNAVWSRNAVLYEMNLRQTTSEGTLAAAAERLGFLRDLGIDAVWLMPHYPIGEVGRKCASSAPSRAASGLPQRSGEVPRRSKYSWKVR